MSVAVDPEVAALVREVLAEEVARLRAEKGRGGTGAPAAREERVRIRSDADLRKFARRVLELAEDREARRAFDAGRIIFRLDGDEARPTGSASRPPGARLGEDAGHVETVERGLLSERLAERLPRETKRIRLGRRVRLTPLARDRLRRRGIVIERMEQ